MIKRLTLSNGTRVVLEKIKYLDTVSMGFWFSVGSASESKEENGYTHFVEHMLFKGTKNHDAKALIKEIEGVGGVLNAFTSRHFTSFYVSITSKYFSRGINILMDIMKNSIFDAEEIEREKRVIIEEIKMSNDLPEEITGQQFFKNAYKGTSMTFPIAGTISNIKKIEKKSIHSYFKNNLNSNNLIISIAGNFDIDEAERVLSNFNIEENKKNEWYDIPFHYSTKSTEKNDLNQVYFSLITPSFKAGDKRNYTISAINDAFGGSSYSRLFQTIREKKGLCYNIYSYNSAFANGGTFEIHGSTSLKNYAYTIESIHNEVEGFLKEKISETELNDAKEMYRGSIAFNKLNPEFLMNKNAKHEYYYNRHVPFKEMYKSVDKINMKDSHAIIEELLGDKKFFLTAVGPLETNKKTKDISDKLNLN